MKTLTDKIRRGEKWIFLNHSLETRLVGWFVRTSFPSFTRSSDLQNPNRQLVKQQYIYALALIDTFLMALKRLDNKIVLTEVQFLESRVYRGIGNFVKAKVWRPKHPCCFRFEASLHIRYLPYTAWRCQLAAYNQTLALKYAQAQLRDVESMGGYCSCTLKSK